MHDLKKETQSTPSSLPPSEDTGEDAISEPGSGFSPDIESAGVSISDV